ncbi:MAG: DUF2851 family protein [Siphonobacter sp.]
MNEAFLHYIWQFQQYRQTDLVTHDQQVLQIISPGKPHQHAGADFQNARIRLNNLEWAGAVEVHIRSSDWFRHHHEQDSAYENVILHVVWTDDERILRKDGTELPTLSLQSRTDSAWLERYTLLLENQEELACGEAFGKVSELTRHSMLDRALIQRLEHKAEKVGLILAASQWDWEETTWQLLSRAMGSPINSEPMEWLARLVPFRTLRKHRNHIFQLEALLLGAAGLIPEQPQDSYGIALLKEANYLLNKYQITPLPRASWKFLRLRPASFPTVRIAQLAQVLHRHNHLFSTMIEPTDLNTLRSNLTVSLSDYWQNHYTFGKITKTGVTQLGQETIDRLIINTIVPLLAYYAQYKGDSEHTDRAIWLLEQLPAEQNHIITTWKKYGLRSQNAADSQGLLEWKQRYCEPRKCLSCSVGISILRN